MVLSTAWPMCSWPVTLGGRHHNGIGFLVGVGLGVEVAAILPELVDPVLHLAGIILLCEFLHGQILLFYWWGTKKPPHGNSMGRLNLLCRGTTQIARGPLGRRAS